MVMKIYYCRHHIVFYTKERKVLDHAIWEKNIYGNKAVIKDMVARNYRNVKS